MAKDIVSVDDIISLLNELIELDRPAIAALIVNRVPCNSALADHPTVQCGSQHGGYHVGLLGIINGMFDVDEQSWGPIRCEFSECDLLRFSRVKHDETKL